MRLIALPGRNPETEAWMRALVACLDLSHLDLNLEEAAVVCYRHWDDGGEPDVAFEAQRLELAVGDLVISKSLGTLVLLTAARSGCMPVGGVFIGTPIRGYSESNVGDLKAFANSCATLFIQQTSDFTGTCAELEGVLGDVAFGSLVEVAGDDHVYADVDRLAEIIESWWRGQQCRPTVTDG